MTAEVGAPGGVEFHESHRVALDEAVEVAGVEHVNLGVSWLLRAFRPAAAMRGAGAGAGYDGGHGGDSEQGGHGRTRGAGK